MLNFTDQTEVYLGQIIYKALLQQTKFHVVLFSYFHFIVKVVIFHCFDQEEPIVVGKNFAS